MQSNGRVDWAQIFLWNSTAAGLTAAKAVAQYQGSLWVSGNSRSAKKARTKRPRIFISWTARANPGGLEAPVTFARTTKTQTLIPGLLMLAPEVIPKPGQGWVTPTFWLASNMYLSSPLYSMSPGKTSRRTAPRSRAMARKAIQFFRWDCGIDSFMPGSFGIV